MGADYGFCLYISSTNAAKQASLTQKDIADVVVELGKRSEMAEQILRDDGLSFDSNHRYNDYEDIRRAMEELTAEPQNADMILEIECDPCGTGPDHFCTVVHKGVSKEFHSETTFPGLHGYYESLRSAQ